jgi:hypothetical protein
MIRSSLTFATMVVIGVLALTGSASAVGVKPLERAIQDPANIAIDGTDFYWLDQQFRRDKAKHRTVFETVLFRGSFLNRSVKRIVAFDDEENAVADYVLAGGGFVFVNMLSVDESESRVERFARDGSNRVTLAKGKRRSGYGYEIKNGVVRLTDCGTRVEALSTSAEGGVVIEHLATDRDSTRCGRKRNWDHRRYYEFTPGGAIREITTESSPVTHTIKLKGQDWGGSYGPVRPPVAEPTVFGDKAVYGAGHYDNFLVRDLKSGAVTGPYTRPLKGSPEFTDASLSPSGQLAYTSFRLTGKGNSAKLNRAAGVFDTAAGPTAFRPVAGYLALRYCGSHLIADTNRGVQELDPATGAFVRQIAPERMHGTPIFTFYPCTNDYVYADGTAGKKYANALFAFPLN